MDAPPLSFMIESVTVSPVEPNQTDEHKTLLPGFAEEQASFTAEPSAPKLRSIDGNPDAPTTPREGAPKLRVIDGK